MEKAQVLVRQVARAFYTTDQVVVIDALVNHIAVNVEELRRIFVSTGRNKNDLLKLLGPLRESMLVSMYAILSANCIISSPIADSEPGSSAKKPKPTPRSQPKSSTSTSTIAAP
jgi:hypothetical protein